MIKWLCKRVGYFNLGNMDENTNLEVPSVLKDTPEAGLVQGLQTRRRLLKWSGLGILGVAGAGYYWMMRVPYLHYDGRHAHATAAHPRVIHLLVRAANELVDKPYKPGGGHQVLFDNGYDCSGSISYVLTRAGLLNRPLTSAEFVHYGQPGPGQYISIFVKPGHHVFMSICGLRFDTSTYGDPGRGPEWRATARPVDGFVNRHPAYL